MWAWLALGKVRGCGLGKVDSVFVFHVECFFFMGTGKNQEGALFTVRGVLFVRILITDWFVGAQS